MTEAASGAVLEHMVSRIEGPVELEVMFFLERPATISVKQRPWPIKPPDIDKLVRGVCDAVTDAGVWEDDGQVVKVTAWKCYADTREPGASVKISPVFDPLGLDLS